MGASCIFRMGRSMPLFVARVMPKATKSLTEPSMPSLPALCVIWAMLSSSCSRLSESVAFSRLSAFMKDQGMVSSFMVVLLWST